MVRLTGWVSFLQEKIAQNLARARAVPGSMESMTESHRCSLTVGIELQSLPERRDGLRMSRELARDVSNEHVSYESDLRVGGRFETPIQLQKGFITVARKLQNSPQSQVGFAIVGSGCQGFTIKPLRPAEHPWDTHPTCCVVN
jgi:hypothetical protein